VITHLRNRALKQLGISFALLMATIFLLVMGVLGVPKLLIAVAGIPAGTFALVFYVKGNIALCEAKGHSGSAVAAIIIVAAICTGALFFAMPLIIYFGLDDRVKRKKRSHRSDGGSERFKPIAELPPRREE